MRTRIIGATALTLFIAYRLLAVANYEPENALGIARAQGVPTTIVGTVVPVLPHLVPLLAAYTAIGTILAALIPLLSGTAEVFAVPGIGLIVSIALCGASLLLSGTKHTSIGGLFWQGAEFAFVHEWQLWSWVAGLFVAAVAYFAHQSWESNHPPPRRVGIKVYVVAVRPLILPAARETWIKLYRSAFPRPRLAVDIEKPAAVGDETTSPTDEVSADVHAVTLLTEADDPAAAEPTDGKKKDRKPDPELNILRIGVIVLATWFALVSLGLPDAHSLALHPLDVARSMWLPEEAIVVTPSHGPASVRVGYVLDDGQDWMTVLNGDDRTITYLQTSQVSARTVCVGRDAGPTSVSLPFWHAGGTVIASPPPCDSVKP